MTASADITVEQVQDVLVVPNSAFRYSPPVVAEDRKGSGLLGVLFSPPASPRRTTTTNAVSKEGYRNLWVLRDGTATRIAVKTGVTDGDLTQVLEGDLAEGDAVITAAALAK
jgi:HlyD family secretion protein